MKIFSRKKEYAKRTLYFFSIPIISYYKKDYLKISNKGENNIIEAAKEFKGSIQVKGNNNKVIIESAPDESVINFFINGSNNTVIIEKPLQYRYFKLNIGHYLSFNNCLVHFKENTSVESLEMRVEQSGSRAVIEKNCMLSSNIFIRQGEVPHLVFDSKTKEYRDLAGDLLIDEHSWIGEGVTLLKNAKIPKNSIVAAKSVVTKSFLEEAKESTAGLLIAGNPATVKKKDVYWLGNESCIESKEDEIYIQNYLKYKNSI